MHQSIIANALLGMLLATPCQAQESAVKPKTDEAQQNKVSDAAVLSKLTSFVERAKTSERLNFSKIGDNGVVTLTLWGTTRRLELEDIAACIGPLKFSKLERIDPGLHKPTLLPAWRIEILEEAFAADGKKRTELDESISMVILQRKTITLFFKDGSMIDCLVEREFEFGRDDKLWSLFGKLLIVSLH